MAKTFQGKPVTEIRAAKQGDKGFAAGQDQVVIRNEDGTEQTVAKSELKDA